MDKNSKIYVAGHRGLVGSALIRQLASKGYKNIITRTSSELDLRDQVATLKFFEENKPDYVFLAAAKVGGINANNIYRAEFILDNLLIQNSVVSASYKNNVKKLLFLGSVCIYPKNAQLPIVEESLLTGELEYTNEPYALAKIAGIKLVESFNIQYGTNYLSVQPANLYGPNDNYDLEKSHVIPALIRKMVLSRWYEQGSTELIAKNLNINSVDEKEIAKILSKSGITKEDGKVSISVWGSGKPSREFLHSDDMAEACIYIMNNVDFKDLTKDLREVRNTHINLGTGADISIKDLVNAIKDIVGFEGSILFDTSKPDGTYRRYMSIDKIHKLGWKHKIDLMVGLNKEISNYLKEANA